MAALGARRVGVAARSKGSSMIESGTRAVVTKPSSSSSFAPAAASSFKILRLLAHQLQPRWAPRYHGGSAGLGVRGSAGCARLAAALRRQHHTCRFGRFLMDFAGHLRHWDQARVRAGSLCRLRAPLSLSSGAGGARLRAVRLAEICGPMRQRRARARSGRRMSGAQGQARALRRRRRGKGSVAHRSAP